ncbi:MAG: hypothetical protein OXB88_11090 [Bacteriovoracales bacterium]|nr:hypothetical protein [Bacteriovoracales bacterium]
MNKTLWSLLFFSILSIGLHAKPHLADEEECLEKLLKKENQLDICQKEINSVFRESIGTIKSMRYLGHRSYPTTINDKKGILSLAHIYIPGQKKRLTLVHKFYARTSGGFLWWKKSCALEHLESKKAVSFPTNKEDENDFLEDFFCPSTLDDHIPLTSSRRAA